MSDYIVDSADLTSVANAIRTKGGTSAQLSFPTGFISAIGNIPTGGVGPQLELIGTDTRYLAEYTNTSTAESYTTNINIKATDYAWIVAIITCDSAITTSSEWGMSICFGGRYKSNSQFMTSSTMFQRGSATLSFSAMVNNSVSTGSYGVLAANNTQYFTYSRKCHATALPKIRAGNYTAKVYGIKSL